MPRCSCVQAISARRRESSWDEVIQTLQTEEARAASGIEAGTVRNFGVAVISIS